MKVRLIKDVDTTEGKMPAGTTIDHHDAGWLVLLGTAEHVTDAPPDNQASPPVTTTAETIGPVAFGGVGV